MLYRTIVFVHVLSVIATLGPFSLLYFLLPKLRLAEGNLLQAYLFAFRKAVWLSKHGGHVLVTTGVILVWAGPWPWRDVWIVLTLIVLVPSLAFMARAFSPTLRKLEATQDESGRAALVVKLRRNVHVYVSLMLIMLWFMVAKPGLG